MCEFSKMKNIHIFCLLCSFLKICVSLENVWHSYQYDPIHKSREEVAITNITSDANFTLDYVVTKWRSLNVEKTCYLAGLTTKNVVITSLVASPNGDSFVQKSYTIDVESEPIDVALFQYWNVTSENYEAMVVIASKKPQLLWYRINETDFSLFWFWPLTNNISHINIFQINYDYQLLMINQHLTHITADIYEFVIEGSPHFWLRQKLELSDPAISSAVVPTGPDNFIAIPQKSLNALLIFKFKDNHFVFHKNLTSEHIDEVVTFRVGQKMFLAFNGFEASIYRFTRNDLVKESVVESHLEGVNYWLPISFTTYGDDTILIAQRVLDHGPHKSYVIEIITYNGDRFEEHEDIPCTYFGELKLSCLSDEEAQMGIVGSVPVFLDDVIGILVPRKDRPSELFLLKTQVKKISNPIHSQIEKFGDMKKHINEVLTAQEVRRTTMAARQSGNLSGIKNQLKQIEDFVKNQTKKNLLPHYETIIFNGVVKVAKSGIFDEVEAETINGKAGNNYLEDIVLKNNVREIKSSKTFENLEVKDVVADAINDINSTDLVFNKTKTNLKGKVSITQPLTVLEHVAVIEVNGLVFHEEIVDLEFPLNDLEFENLEISGNALIEKINGHQVLVQTDPENSLLIPGNVEAVNVNGENFNKLLVELCLKNIRNYIPGSVKVNGDVTVLENANVVFINSLKFPEEYVFVATPFPTITGTKHFAKILTTDLSCEKIDDISPLQIITLSTDQHIPGTTNFTHLKITESLNVGGNIVGEHASKFLPNPTLLKTNFVKSKVHFKNLEVQGAIIVTENFNGKNLELQLSDVIYKDEEEPIIEAIKQFPEGFVVRKNLWIRSNSINNVTLDSIVTKDTEQTLNLTQLKGVVTFGSLETEGLYNSVDIEQLDGELVKLDGEQYISSTLIFEENVDVKKLEILESAKNLTSNLDTLNKEDVMEVENIVIEGNMVGVIHGFNIKDFDFRRLSLSKAQLVETDFVLDRSSVANMSAVFINSIKSAELTKSWCQEKLLKRFLNGELAVENFVANSSIEIDQIDGKKAFSLGSFWKHDVKKYNITKLVINEDTFFVSVEIEKLSGVNFNRFINRVVFKNETNVVIKGKKTFFNGLHVKKLMEIQTLNDIPLSDILTRHGRQEILGPITVQGDVVFNNVTVSESINDMMIKEITDVYQVDDRFRITGDVVFHRLAHIYDLQIQGYVTDRRAQEVVNGIIYIDDDFKVESLMTFENQVKMEKNIRVKGKINNVDLTAFVSDMVMITKDATIRGPVRFKEEIRVEDEISVHKKFETKSLNDVDFQSWNDSAIFVTEGLLKGNYLFENVRIVDTLVTDYINDIDMKTLIHLRTQQELPDLSFHEVTLFKDVDVGNSTNFCNLSDELANSVLINADQNIDSDVEFRGNVFVERDIDLSGSLNGVETNRLVTTNTDQELDGIYTFKSKTNLQGNLMVDGLVNGIDVDQWAHEAVKTTSKYLQNITDEWFVDRDLILEEDLSGNGLINGIDLQKFSQDVEEKRNHKYQLEKGFIDDYSNICKDLTYMYDKLKKQIYKFNYLENLQTLKFQHKIEHVYSYKYQNRAYLLVSEKKNCESHLFIFDSRFRYVRNVHFGQIAQIISVHFDESIFLVVRNQPFYSTCKVQGTSVWQPDEDFTNLAKIEDQDLLQESLEPGVFYGLREHVITEFKLYPKFDMLVKKCRRWQVQEDNMAFVPRGLATGLAIRTGRKLIQLHRDDPITDNFSEESEEIILGKSTETFNTYLPGRKGSDLVVMKVGIKGNKRNLLAVASHEETSVRGSLDFIKIYEDVIGGKVFHKVPSYRPSSLLVLDFDNGETLLTFMEDERVLQVYEYKGIEGFKHKLSLKLEGSKLFTLPVTLDGKESKVVGLIDKNKVSFMEVVMLGNQVEKNLDCLL